jgi:branched-chain amino acid aminotransferase
MAFYQYFNGEVLPMESAIYQSNDLGLLRGYGLFDYFRTYNGLPFRWDDYWQRFENSARLLKLKVPLTQEAVEKILADLFALSGENEVAFRFVLTGGYAPDSVHVLAPNFLIRTEPLPADHPAGRLQGIKVLPYEYVRDLPEVKTTNYMHMVLMDGEMKRQQASDLLFHKHGEISELTRSNLFLFKGDILITSNQNILNGITRRVVMELATSHFEIQVRPVSLEEALGASEAFTTSTTKWVMPVVAVGDRLIADGVAGKNTRFLQQLFEQYVHYWGR